MENEISSLIANEMGIPSEEDLEELNMELNQLMGVQTDSDSVPDPSPGPVKKPVSRPDELDLPEVPTNIILPAVPVGDVNVNTNKNSSAHSSSNKRELVSS